jgi:hypothetical protein
MEKVTSDFNGILKGNMKAGRFKILSAKNEKK